MYIGHYHGHLVPVINEAAQLLTPCPSLNRAFDLLSVSLEQTDLHGNDHSFDLPIPLFLINNIFHTLTSITRLSTDIHVWIQKKIQWRDKTKSEKNSGVLFWCMVVHDVLFCIPIHV